MLQEDIAVKNPVAVLGPFVDDALAASQSNAQLTLAPVDNDGIVMPKAGYVIGIAGTLTAASTAGNLSVGVTIDGTEKTATTQAITTATEFYDTFDTAGDAIRFAAGEQIGVEITTDGDWTAETMDLAVFVFVVFEDWDY